MECLANFVLNACNYILYSMQNSFFIWNCTCYHKNQKQIRFQLKKRIKFTYLQRGTRKKLSISVILQFRVMNWKLFLIMYSNNIVLNTSSCLYIAMTNYYEHEGINGLLCEDTLYCSWGLYCFIVYVVSMYIKQQ